MLSFNSFSKNKLSLALSSVLAGAMLSAPAQAVQLASDDGLGDAAIFQYFSAKGNWQTFFRLINTSNNAVVVKVRFREAANSRELQDFLIALSPNDMWSAWTDANAYGGQPGIRTNDTSCIFDLVDSGNTTFQTINGNLKGVAFSDAAFTNSSGSNYADGSGKSTIQRLSEGYVEMIGVASFAPGTAFARAITHGSNDMPNDCTEGMNLLRNGPGANASVGNVLGANAQLINVANGEGAGYDPTVLANFSSASLLTEALFRTLPNGVGHGSWPTLDSADPASTVLTTGGTAIRSIWDLNGDGLPQVGDTAAQQLLANGTVAQITRSVVDLNQSGTANQAGITVQNSDGSVLALNVSENNVPAAVVAALAGRRLIHVVAGVAADGSGGTVAAAAPAVNNAILVVRIVDGIANSYTAAVAQTTVAATPLNAARRTNIPYSGTSVNVRGGIDAVSSVLARRNIVNEWGAFSGTTGVIKEYFTQWVLTFPTKHYYVDLQNDPNTTDLFAPTLWDPRPNPDLNDAFAPFSFEFDMDGDGAAVIDNAGMSCEAYTMNLWNTEEATRGFNSPTDFALSRLCDEVNVLSFGTTFATKGLNSSFSAVAPQTALPPNRTQTPFVQATNGWANLAFTGTGQNTGLNAVSTWTTTNGTNVPQLLNTTNGLVRYQGLPVDGFMLTNYGTGNIATNHSSINSHKYQRSIQGWASQTANTPAAIFNAVNSANGTNVKAGNSVSLQ